MNPKLDSEAPIGTVAPDFPELIAMFDRFSLDYCCHGQNTLAEACRNAGIRIGEVIAAAEAISPEPIAAGDCTRMSISELCDEIVRTHHAHARDLFKHIARLLTKVIGVHGGALPELHELNDVVRFLRAEMLEHMLREERILFPWLRELDQMESVHAGLRWSVQNPIDCMVHDHEVVARALVRTRELSTRLQEQAPGCLSMQALFVALRELEADTRHHIHKENNVLFPAGLRAEAAIANRRARLEERAS